ncbi:MAG: hypothetical protein ACKVQR_13755 [Aquabacterium sp.]
MPEKFVTYSEFSDTLTMVNQLESRVDRHAADMNKALMHAKNFDGNLDKRLTDLETRLNQTRDHMNVILQKAKDYDSGLDKRLGAVEKRLDETRDHLNTILQKAKDYDSGLDRRLTSVEASVKDLNKASANSDGLNKREVTTLIESKTSALERDLNSDIKDLRKQVDTLARAAKR